MHQLEAQFVGSLACVIIVTSVALIIMFGIRQLRGSWNLRLDRELELEGLDITEHGTPAYHMEFGYGMSYTTPTGSTVIGGGMGASPPISTDPTLIFRETRLAIIASSSMPPVPWLSSNRADRPVAVPRHVA
jgi:hypothetical protein